MPKTLSTPQRRALAEEGAKWLGLPLHRGSGPSSIAAHMRHPVRLMSTGRKAPGVGMPLVVEFETARLVDFVTPTVS